MATHPRSLIAPNLPKEVIGSNNNSPIGAYATTHERATILPASSTTKRRDNVVTRQQEEVLKKSWREILFSPFIQHIINKLSSEVKNF